MMKNLSPLEKILKIKFKNKNFLRQALVHRSYLNEHPNFPLSNNERLEFLGDAVLELIVTKFLFKKIKKQEGELTKLRASLVNTKSLASTMAKLKIEKFFYLSKGESLCQGKAKMALLANTFEAILGAIYLDQGFAKAEKFVQETLLPKLNFILSHKLFKDPKSQFQEIAQRKMKFTPRYELLEEIDDKHTKKFIIGLYIDKKLISQGVGESKHEAEIQAASKAIKKIN